jgi:hypothetical protein
MMDDSEYSNREVDVRFAAVEKTSNDNRALLMEKLDSIYAQTKTTNGRVTKLERWMMIVGTATAVTILLKFPELKPLLGII